jgi:hypothetical protein
MRKNEAEAVPSKCSVEASEVADDDGSSVVEDVKLEMMV